MQSENLPRTNSPGSQHTPFTCWPRLNVLTAVGVTVVLLFLLGVTSSSSLGGAQAFVLISVSPDRIYNHASTLVTITGTSLPVNPHLTINEIIVLDTYRVSSTVLTATIPPDLPSGLYTVSVSQTGSPGDVANLPSALEVVNSGSGELSEWQSVLFSPERRAAEAVEYRNGYIYVVGGLVFSDNPPNYEPIDSLSQTVIRARVEPNGALVDWQDQSSMAARRTSFGTVIVNESLYAVAGYDPFTGVISSTERAHFNADGSLSPWQPSSSLSSPRQQHAVMAYGNHIYAIGGVGSAPTNILASVEMATVSPDGSIPAWQAAASLTEPRTAHAAVSVGNYLYVLGGADRFYNTIYSIESARINPDGSLDTWQVVGSLPSARHTSYVGLAARGFLYIMDRDVQFARLTPDGLFGQWQTGPSHGLLSVASVTLIDGRIYLLGDSQQGSEYISEVKTATINVDFDAPILSQLVANGGAESTTSVGISLTIVASDPSSRVAKMSFSNDGQGWSEWQDMSSPASWQLLSDDGPKTVYARVMDAAGYESDVVSDTIALDTAARPEYGLTIGDGALFTNQISVTLTIGALPGTAMMKISNDGGFAGAAWEPYNSRREWQITQYGNYVIPRVVYVRYQDAIGNVTSTYQDDIILDVIPPSGSVSIQESVAVDLASTKDHDGTITLVLSATDDVSGVGSMQISNAPDFAGTEWQPFLASMLWDLVKGVVYVRFRDNAGNLSATYSADDTANAIFLPIISN